MTQKIALVTGGSRGLGRDMALSLAKKGMDVVLTYHHNEEDAHKVVEQITEMNQKAVAMQLDVSQIKSYDPVFLQLSQVLETEWQTDKFDYLINNAGIGITLPILQVTEDVFDHMMNIHFKGVYFLTQKSLTMMNDGGGLVFISSGTTRFSMPGYSVYSSLKGAIEIFAKSVAKEFGSRGIRSNIVAPGAIETDFNGAGVRNNPQLKAFLSNQTPLGRVGRADDIGSVVAFLCSEDAKWINGQRLEVSGGINL